MAEWTELKAPKGLKGVELYARRRDVRLEVQIDPTYALGHLPEGIGGVPLGSEL